MRESVASKLVEGQSLTAQVDAVNKQYAAAVDEIVPTADPGSRSFVVKVSLTGGSGLYPGMFGRLMIPIGQQMLKKLGYTVVDIAASCAASSATVSSICAP